MSETDEHRTKGNKYNLPQVKETGETHNNTPSMEACSAPCHLTLTLWEALVKINKEKEKHSERDRMGEQSITTIHPLSLNFYFLCVKPFDCRRWWVGCAVAAKAYIPLTLACASVSLCLHQSGIQPGPLRAGVSLPSGWMEACEEPDRWHRLSTHLYVWKEAGRKSHTVMSPHKPELSARSF